MKQYEIIYVVQWLGFNTKDVEEALSVIKELMEEFDTYNDVQKFIIENYDGKKMWLMLLLEEFIRGMDTGFQEGFGEALKGIIFEGVGR